MEAWGVDQEVQKNFYIRKNGELTDELSISNEKIAEANDERDEYKANYARVKAVLAYMCATALTLLYFLFGATILGRLSPFLGAWGWLARLVSPVLVFASGYSAVYLYF